MNTLISLLAAATITLTTPSIEYKPVALAIVTNTSSGNIMLPWQQRFRSVKECEANAEPILTELMKNYPSGFSLVIATCYVPNSIDT